MTKKFLVKVDMLLELDGEAEGQDAFDYVDAFLTEAEQQPEGIVLSTNIREVILSSRRTLK